MGRPSSVVVGGAILLLASSLVARSMIHSFTSDRGDLEVAAFFEQYSKEYVAKYTASSEAAWRAGTDVSEQHTNEQVVADLAFSEFAGAADTITKLKEFKQRTTLSDLQRREVEKALLKAAESPATVPDVVKARVAAEARQRAALDGFRFMMADGKGGSAVVTPNDLDGILRTSRDLDERRRAWEASKTSGVALKKGLLELRDLRNKVARELGYSSYFALQVADYGMTVPEMMALLDGVLADMRPAYEQLHAYARRQLAKRYAQPVPDLIPAHWLSNRWSQEWPGLVDGIDLDPLFASMKPEQLIRTAEDFYVSMGFPKLPPSFYDKSDLYALPAGSPRMKNTHASAWHIDLGQDVRSLMSVESDFQWFTTTHHELGHIYYYIAYTRPEVPPLLREGANRAFHEGIGELISLAASQQSYLRSLGVLPSDQKIDNVQWLLNDATMSIVFLPWSAGVMSHWEHDFYELELPADQMNARWWHYVKKYQGIEPPSARGEEFCDAATKTHINDDPAAYYDYALATLLKFQFHRTIARDILKTDYNDANYRGSVATGDFLRSILREGQTRDWRDLVKETTGEEMSGKAMLEYYTPLVEWLKKDNAGTKVGF
jgi:peptidyl-dipeptidase A